MPADSHRSVTINRTSAGRFTATNGRGGENGDTARALVPHAVQRSRDRLCTVSRTVELGAPIATYIES